MPQYLLSVCFDEPYDDVDLGTGVPAPDGSDGRAQRRDGRAGAWVFVAGLRPASSATVVRAVGGEVSMTDGPYAETKEQMGGFWVIEPPTSTPPSTGPPRPRPPASGRSRSDPHA